MVKGKERGRGDGMKKDEVKEAESKRSRADKT